MSGWSVVGCGLIVGSALWAVLGKEAGVKSGAASGAHEDADVEMAGGVRDIRRTESGEEEEGAPMLKDTELEEDIPRGRRTD